jgi:hypothetical protein
MSSYLNVPDVLKAFTEAKDAYEALPEARRTIAQLEAQVTRMTKDGDDLVNKLQEAERAKAETEAKLKATEVERDQYYFRSEELAEKVEKTASFLGLIAPKTEQEPKVIEASHPQSQQGQSADPLPEPDHSSTITGKAPEQFDTEASHPSEGQSASHPTQSGGATGTGSGSMSVPNATGHASGHHAEGQSVSHPTESSPATSPQSGSENAPNDASSQDGNTHSTETASASHAPSGENVHTMTPSQQGNTTTKPHEGEPSWHKPHHMSWQEWKDLGGNVPSWANVA